ncbi:MAG TPA: Glu-tRNA(Gln) amidotransferase subunit GatE [Bacteroidetes bacterium]|nr:Glu-tRNA(Gln) amidotransferase subunit GatE [Bacteroidota bacterium]HEX03722.1 Glu-tRNA(Gln) amidotransferase subunit GatE [Bacteroidota bacterium]
MNATAGIQTAWKKMGFNCGLEIHHQIMTEKKLFCHCPAGKYSDTWHAEVMRHMRPTLSELGEYDGTALMEFKTRKEIIYRLNRESVCTYEMDDTPPFLINQKAIDIALTIALAFKCKIVGELHILRKQYLDGSIPTGFQRTAIVGVDGEFPLSNGKIVNVIQLGLEEDSCREISDNGHRIVFMADRLSMPLIEVVTENTLETPEEAQEAAMQISRMLRATQMVRRGSGAGREDVNVSIKGTTRVEIKGVPAIARIAALTDYEAHRQQALLGLREEMLKRGFKAGDRPGRVIELSLDEIRPNHPDLAAAKQVRDSVRAIVFPNAKDLIIWPLHGRTFADDLSGQIRVVACLDQLPNLLHTDGPNGGLDEYDLRIIESETNLKNDEVAVIVWGSEEDTNTAANELLDRFAQAIVAVPNETRQALKNNRNDFERVLPGPDRMYPDTDSPPSEITDERVKAASKNVPIAPWVREKIYREQQLPDDVVDLLPITRYAPRHDKLVDNNTITPMRSGEVLARMMTALERREYAVDQLSIEQLEDLLNALGAGHIHREGLFDLLKAWTSTPSLTFVEMLERLEWTEIQEYQITTIIQEAIEIANGEAPRLPENLFRMAMGHAMDVLRGRVDSRIVLDKMKQLIG